MKTAYLMGIDLGGTKIGGVLTDAAGAVLAETVVPTEASKGRLAVLARIREVGEALLHQSGAPREQVAGAVVATPGALDARRGVVLRAANLPLAQFALAREMEARFGFPVRLENDANAAALAEARCGAGRGAASMLFVVVSTGIGAAAVLDGALYRGATGNALEIGHTIVVKDGLPCGCGSRGCAEAYASGMAIARAARQAIGQGEASAIGGSLTPAAEAVFAAAAAGDKAMARIVEAALEYLGLCVANAAAVFDPDRIVVGGGIAQAGAPVFAALRSAVDAHCLTPVAAHCEFVPAALGVRAGAIGAALLAGDWNKC